MHEKNHHLITLAKAYLAEGAPCGDERVLRAISLITALSEALIARGFAAGWALPHSVRHVLIVDDDEFSLKILRNAAITAGFQESCIHSCNNAETALGIIALSKIDCACVDYNLVHGGSTSLTGVDIVRFLKERNPAAMAVIITGSVNPSVVTEAAKVGVTAVLSKQQDLCNSAVVTHAAFTILANYLQVSEDA